MPLSLVAFYGPEAKPAPLVQWIESLQVDLAERLGAAFQPRPIEQVHATVVGLASVRVDGRLWNANSLRLRAEHRALDLPKLVEIVRAHLPLALRFGGFSRDAPFGFTSRGRSLYERSLSVQQEQVVGVGWPVTGRGPCGALGDLRFALEGAGALHKYHASPDGRDDDAFLVLGRVDARVLARAEDAAEALRERLGGEAPVRVSLGPAQLSFVAYTDPALPLSGSERFPLEAGAHAPDSLLRRSEGAR